MTCREFDSLLRGNADELREETCKILFIDAIRILDGGGDAARREMTAHFCPCCLYTSVCVRGTHPKIFTNAADASDASNTKVPLRLSKKDNKKNP